MKLSKQDWHQEWCDEQCETLYCKKHRIVYQWCQSGTAFDEYQGFVEIDDAGRCLKCESDRAIDSLHDMDIEYAKEAVNG